VRLSTRNQLPGTIVEVNLGIVMATVKVRLDGGEQVVTASITKDAALDLGLEVGQPATVFIKSTEVTIGVD
jgi:molybdopterin-binding protein